MATSSTAISLPGASCRARTLLALPSMSAPRRGPGRARFVTAAAMPPAPEPKARVLVAAKRKGFDVVVLERDVSAVRGEGRYRGPIQLQSNALAAVEAIDTAAADEVMDAGCVTGDRINGIVDGISGSWYIKFDIFTPAAERGLPVTRVISRMALQQILAPAVGFDAILNESHVVDFIDDGNKVTAILEDGRRFEGDLLVRKKLFGHLEATYSGYSCYTGVADFVPPDIDTVGFRLLLGHEQYFGFSDVGASKVQWYALHKEEAGGTDPENGKKKRLLEIFGGWCDIVVDLINATEEDAILRRDIYDRPPIMNWGRGRDGYQLAVELESAWQESAKSGAPMDIASSLKRYEKERRLRVAIIHGLARMAAIMATIYTPHLGVGLRPLAFLTKSSRFLIKYGMDMMLSWVLTGDSSKLEGRTLRCLLSDKANDQLYQWLEDDDAMEEAMGGQWYLFPTSGGNSGCLQPVRLFRDEQSQSDPSDSGSSLSLSLPQISERHATITCKNKAFYVTDLGSEHGTWITDNVGRLNRVPPNFPVRFRPSDLIRFGYDKKAMFRVKVLNTLPYEYARRGKQHHHQQQVLQAA
ncbi:hypothetical protein PAHAL_7G169900 [Panicum hallii]|uniref:FHA domain-containing protein n=1 Tax=Panicum hallii TaxID=206008 RepID=A0A2S3I765_9POAL|nr:hypothetical protein PAHAL_7G169900 [Panicum hallii]